MNTLNITGLVISLKSWVSAGFQVELGFVEKHIDPKQNSICGS